MNVPRVARIVSTILFTISVSSALSLDIRGPYANRLSSSDIVQIKAAISRDQQISHNVRSIEAIRPDKVSVQTTTRTAVDEDTQYEFNAYKRSGVWRIDEDSIQISIEKRDFRTNGPTYLR
jgi:hypothetical protein